jgi:hypothetical protein
MITTNIIENNYLFYKLFLVPMKFIGIGRSPVKYL